MRNVFLVLIVTLAIISTGCIKQPKANPEAQNPSLVEVPNDKPNIKIFVKPLAPGEKPTFDQVKEIAQFVLANRLGPDWEFVEACSSQVPSPMLSLVFTTNWKPYSDMVGGFWVADPSWLILERTGIIELTKKMISELETQLSMHHQGRSVKLEKIISEAMDTGYDKFTLKFSFVEDQQSTSALPKIYELSADYNQAVFFIDVDIQRLPSQTEILQVAQHIQTYLGPDWSLKGTNISQLNQQSTMEFTFTKTGIPPTRKPAMIH